MWRSMAVSPKAPCGGEVAGRSPVDRGKQGLKRSTVVDAAGIPLGSVPAPANRPDSPLLEATLATLDGLGPLPNAMTVHLDRGYDSGVTRERLARRGLQAAIARKGRSAPIAASQRWPVERTHAWTNAHKKLALVHRAPAGGGRVLAGLLGRDHHRASAGARRLAALPLGRATRPQTLSRPLLAQS